VHGLDIRLVDTWWLDDFRGGPVPLSVSASGILPTGEVVAPITAATLALVAVSARVLWGNVASAVYSAAEQVAAHRPDLEPGAQAAATAFLRQPKLRHERQLPGPTFRRSSCCLIYQLAPTESARSQVCGDCILASRSRR
jgi:hypothetical protein